MNSQNLFFFLSFTCVFSFPTNENPEEIQHQLLNPELNSVLEKGNQDGSEAPITKDIFPDRQGFVTGHRIPLELFSKETIQSLKPVSFLIKKITHFLDLHTVRNFHYFLQKFNFHCRFFWGENS